MNNLKIVSTNEEFQQNLEAPKKSQALNTMDLTFVLRTMLFSFPVHVAALGSVGVSAKEVVALEGLFLLGSSITQLAGGIINDALSPRLAYGLGKLIAGLACAALALFHGSVSFGLLFAIWGAGVGIYDGSDFLSANRKDSNWSSTLRHVESLGIYGSLISFICGAMIFRHFGFGPLFAANAVAALSIPVLLAFRKNRSLVRLAISNQTKQNKFQISSWLRSVHNAPFLEILGYASATVALKVAVIELQHFLATSGVNVAWNGWIFVGFTVLVYLVLRFRPSSIGLCLVPTVIGFGVCSVFGIKGILFGLAISSLAVFIRSGHKVLFFSALAEKANPKTLGRDSSLAQILAGLFLLVGTRGPFGSNQALLLGSASVAAIAFCFHKFRRPV